MIKRTPHGGPDDHEEAPRRPQMAQESPGRPRTAQDSPGTPPIGTNEA